jgi:SH3-like domain-containing protein
MQRRPIPQILTLTAIAGLTLLTTAASAWARPAYLTADQQNATINVRSTPDTTADIVTSGKVGTPIEVLRQVAPPDQDYAWAYVKLGQSQGWIRANYVDYGDDRKTYGTLYGQSLNDRINVRSGPSTTGKIVREGLPGDMVQVLRTLKGDGGYNWHSLLFADGTKGWVREDLIIIWTD